jgi:hypothetical protein
VLKVRIVVEAVADDMVGVVVALPSNNVKPGEAVTGEHLNDSVEEQMASDEVVVGIVAHPPGLDPDEPNEAAWGRRWWWRRRR